MKYRDENGDLKQIYLPFCEVDKTLTKTVSVSAEYNQIDLNQYGITDDCTIISANATGYILVPFVYGGRWFLKTFNTLFQPLTSDANITFTVKYKTSNSSLSPLGNILNEKSTSTENTYSCDYVNKIVESGTNDNGTFIKYENGDMICHHRAIVQNPNFIADGSMYTATVENLFTFPVSFVGNPDVVCSTANNEDYAFSMVLGVIRDNAGISKIRLLRYKVSANQSLYVHYIAMGKWK